MDVATTQNVNIQAIIKESLYNTGIYKNYISKLY